MTEAEMHKIEGEEKVVLLLAEARTKIKQAEDMADAYGISFNYIPDNVGDYYGRGSISEYTDEVVKEGEWYPSSWSSSSVYC